MPSESGALLLFCILVIGPFLLWGIVACIFIILRDWLGVFHYGILPSTRREIKDLEAQQYIDDWPCA